MSVDSAVQQCLLAFSALISIVNPIGGALIFAQVTGLYSHAERVLLSRRIGVYAALVMLGALWAGTPILNVFGVSLGALRIAGGLVVMSSAWTLLNRPEAREARKQAEASGSGERPPGPVDEAGREPPGALAEIAFFPLTLPFTTGPGTIAVAITLGANRPGPVADRLGFYLGITVAALAVALVVALAACRIWPPAPIVVLVCQAVDFAGVQTVLEGASGPVGVECGHGRPAILQPRAAVPPPP